MSEVIARVTGQVRGVRELLRKEPDERGNRTAFGRELSVLTDSGSHLGDTLAVTVFSQDLPNLPKTQQVPGARVDLTVGLKSSAYGLRAVYKGPGDAVYGLEIPDLEDSAA